MGGNRFSVRDVWVSRGLGRVCLSSQRLAIMLAELNGSHVAGNLLVAFYVSILLMVATYGFHRYILLYLYRKYKHNTYTPKADFAELPRITIQLPMFNEDSVAQRIINATCLIDYPLDKLEIQVLDDSTDHSAEIAKAAVHEWAVKGYPIKYLHRENRVGYKAGALAEGM